MNTALALVTPRTSPNMPEKQLFWQGFDTFHETVDDPLTEGELAAMTPEERRGYDHAARCAADADTEAWLLSLNVNAYGDRTEW